MNNDEKDYTFYNLEVVKYDFDDRDLEYPPFKYIKFNFIRNAPEDFANGSRQLDNCDESLNIIYKIGLYLPET